LVLAIMIPGQVAAAKWMRLNASTLLMQGPIERDDFAKFEAKFDGRVRRLVVTSEGGVEFQALQIGEVLARQGVDVYVQGYCASACANFIFVAGRRRILIGDAIVGYHGSEVSALQDEVAFRKELEKSLPPEGVEWKVAWVQRLGARARNLYHRQGATSKILDLSACVVSHSGERVRKFQGDESTGGTSVTSRSKISLWVPSHAQFQAYGMTVRTAERQEVAALGLPASARKADRRHVDMSDVVHGESGVPADCLE
jgi:hypothetical protein